MLAEADTGILFRAPENIKNNSQFARWKAIGVAWRIQKNFKKYLK